MRSLTLVSHQLCPYVQRAAISLAEKGVPFERQDVDLANKPHWFCRISPLGKVPLLQVAIDEREETIFESTVILEYIEETQPSPLHPSNPLERARHRSWIEFGSSILNRIAAFYNAKTDASLIDETAKLSKMFERLEPELANGPWFAGERFSLADAVFGPVFRYFDTFDDIEEFGMMRAAPRVTDWRATLAARPSVKSAVAPDYDVRLRTFLINRKSALSERIATAP